MILFYFRIHTYVVKVYMKARKRLIKFKVMVTSREGEGNTIRMDTHLGR